MTITTPDGGLDLAERRRQRAKARAARREGRGEQFPIRDGAIPIAVLAPEFPLDVLEPLMDVNLDIALLAEQVMNVLAAGSAGDQAQQIASLDMITKILAANPDLFKDLIAALKETARRLFGEQGYQSFTRTRPSPWDVVDLARAVLDWYGVSLGESSQPSAASTGGEISNTTSNGTSGSTSGESGSAPESPAS